MSIGTIIQSVVTMLMQFWSKIPPETKEKIIEAVLKQFEKIFREYFKQYKQKQSSK